MGELAHTTDPALASEADGAHVRVRDWIGDRSIPALGANAGSIPVPIQRPRRFKEAFPPEIVERALCETSGAVDHVADPFGGSGTTATAALRLFEASRLRSPVALCTGSKNPEVRYSDGACEGECRAIAEPVEALEG